MKVCFRSCLERLRQKVHAWRQQFKAYSDKCLQSGFVPLSFSSVQFFTRQLARIMVFIQLGKLRLIGRDNLKIEGRFIFCPNHSSMFDAPVLYSIMKRHDLRYMTAYEEMRGLWGLKAVAMGAMGCFPVDRTKGKSVIEPAVKMLVAGQSLVIFPEGKISHTGECTPFKMGPAVIGKQAIHELGGKERVAIVPMNILYHKRDLATATKGYGAMGLKWRGGVTVTVGEPIWINDIKSGDPKEIMDAAHRFVCKAQAHAKQMGCPCDR